MSTSKGKLVVIEGGDGAGKNTQTTLFLSSYPGVIRKFDFPRYETVVGRAVKDALNGKFGDFLGMNPVLSSALYTLDRMAAKLDLEEALSGGVVICNRYTPSNIAYQAAKLLDAERDKFIEYLEQVEYQELSLPIPDLVLFLDVPITVSVNLLRERGEVLDQHESNLEYQERVAQVYRDLARERVSWKIISCTTNGLMRSPEDIQKDVAEAISAVLTE